MLNFRHQIDTPLGKLTAWFVGEGLKGIYFDAQTHRPAQLDRAETAWMTDSMSWVEAWFKSYFDSKESIPDKFRIDHLISESGTLFQQRVWQALTEIPAGQTRTYAQIAQKVGQPQAARAVASAVAKNPFIILVPCHRVVGSRGELRGYSAGIDRKQWLLAHEQAQLRPN